MSTRRDRELEGDVITKKKKKVQKPKMFKVIFHNDDYTTMEFVVMILKMVFRKTDAESTQVMLHVHRSGHGVAGVYTRDVAETKVTQTLELARQEGHPLMVTMEPE